MAFISDIKGFETGLLTRIGAGASTIAERFERRRLYKTTLRELGRLSERELDDLGIAPGDIHTVAYQGAYGK